MLVYRSVGWFIQEGQVDEYVQNKTDFPFRQVSKLKSGWVIVIYGSFSDWRHWCLKLTNEGVNYLEDHPRYRKWLGSPPFITHEKAIWKGSHNPILRELTITMVIIHLSTSWDDPPSRPT